MLLYVVDTAGRLRSSLDASFLCLCTIPCCEREASQLECTDSTKEKEKQSVEKRKCVSTLCDAHKPSGVCRLLLI
jgi:hypothetical protein